MTRWSEWLIICLFVRLGGWFVIGQLVDRVGLVEGRAADTHTWLNNIFLRRKGVQRVTVTRIVSG